MVKRFFDIFFALFGMMVLSPLILILSILIVLDSRGGIYYIQKRVGKNDRDFDLFKFRSMYTDAHKMGLLTIGKRDPRITKVGYFLRKYKLDELPQLLNILAGDMSIVGPRPEVQKYVDLYNEEQRKVLLVQPGLTDYASLEYINENEILDKSDNPESTYIREIMPAKLKLNLKYISEMSFCTDIKIIVRTVLKILR